MTSLAKAVVRAEVAPSVGSERHCLAVDQRGGAAEASCLGHLCKAIREVGGASAPDLDALAVLKGEDAKAVVFDLMQPAGTRGRGTTSVGPQGRTKPKGAFSRQLGGGARQSAVFKSSLPAT